MVKKLYDKPFFQNLDFFIDIFDFLDKKTHNILDFL